jgi:hypothetical protein
VHNNLKGQEDHLDSHLDKVWDQGKEDSKEDSKEYSRDGQEDNGADVIIKVFLLSDVSIAVGYGDSVAGNGYAGHGGNKIIEDQNCP